MIVNPEIAADPLGSPHFLRLCLSILIKRHGLETPDGTVLTIHPGDLDPLRGHTLRTHVGQQGFTLCVVPDTAAEQIIVIPGEH